MLDNRAANAIFGRIGRVAAEVVLQLLRSKCIPIFYRATRMHSAAMP